MPKIPTSAEINLILRLEIEIADPGCKRHSPRQLVRQLYHDFAERGSRGVDEEDREGRRGGIVRGSG